MPGLNVDHCVTCTGNYRTIPRSSHIQLDRVTSMPTATRQSTRSTAHASKPHLVGMTMNWSLALLTVSHCLSPLPLLTASRSSLPPLSTASHHHFSFPHMPLLTCLSSLPLITLHTASPHCLAARHGLSPTASSHSLSSRPLTAFHLVTAYSHCHSCQG